MWAPNMAFLIAGGSVCAVVWNFDVVDTEALLLGEQN